MLNLRQFFMTIVLSISVIIFGFIASPKTTEAADLYNVLYANISQYNGNTAECDWIAQAIMYASTAYDVDPLLIAAVMQTESGYQLGTASPAGAVGLMQLMPGTAAGVGVNPYNPLDNVIGGTIYLRYMLNDFASWGTYGVTYAVAAYNAGPGAVEKYGGVPPYAETQNYVQRVDSAYQNLLNLCNYY